MSAFVIVGGFYPGADQGNSNIAASPPVGFAVRAVVGVDVDFVGDVVFFGQLPDYAQHAQFCLQIQTVATLDLHGGSAESQHAPQALLPGAEELRITCLTGGAHRGLDTTPGGGDLLVGGTPAAPHELVRAIAREYQVGVTVDQARRQQFAATVDAEWRLVATGELLGGTDVDDLSVGDGDRGILDRDI